MKTWVWGGGDACGWCGCQLSGGDYCAWPAMCRDRAQQADKAAAEYKAKRKDVE